ncbi:MAG TPA: hypothetical protein ENI64_00230 [Gammaproteobacteria bacterium]|nr:hypothetical protein [Gammaproteobacteria bacterium]
MKRLLWLALTLFIISPVAQAEYVAYAVIDGNKKPLPERIDEIPAEDLIKVEWGKYNGNKSRVGVMKVDNKTSSRTVVINSSHRGHGLYGGLYGGSGTTEYSVGGSGVPVEGIDAILTDTLHRSGRFRVVERTALNKTFAEQDLVNTGRISRPSGARTGKTLGAQYLIQAVVTSYEPNFSGNSIGAGGLVSGFLGGLSVSSKKSMVGMNFRLIDAETSEIVYTKQVSAVLEESGIGFGGLGFGGGGIGGGFVNSYSKTPIGQAVIAAINMGVYDLIKQVGAEPVKGSVVKASKGKIYINLGKGVVKTGDILTLLAAGEALIDPETGISLGGDDEEIGNIQVVSVKKKYAIAKAVGSINGKIHKGDKVHAHTAPSHLEFGPAWKTESIFGGDSSDNTTADSGDEDAFDE